MMPVEIHLPADHPTAAGHFPGHPIIPGAVLLDEMLDAFATASTNRIHLIKSAKFFHPVTPGQTIQLHWHAANPPTIKFEIRLAETNTLVASGAFETTPA